MAKQLNYCILVKRGLDLRLMSRTFNRVSLFVLLSCSSLWAQKQMDYRTGRLLKVSDESFVLPDRPGKTAYLLHIREGSDEYFALYNVNFLFGHDRSNLLKPGTDIPYRISGKSLFVKTPDGKEVKGRLCERAKWHGLSGVKCGGAFFGGADADSQAP